MDPAQRLANAAELAKTLEQSTEVLKELLSGAYSVWTDGSLYCIRQQVDRINGLKIEIYAREHAPPHFHVRGGSIDASFSIVDCTLLNGEIRGRDEALVRWWYDRSRSLLIEKWNSSRPTDCPVGPLEE